MAELRLQDLLLAVAHVGELTRLLSVLGDYGGALRQGELVALVNRTAGAGHRYPRPLAALALALQLGLVRRDAGRLRLTPMGRQFLAGRAPSLADLSRGQGQLLLGLILDDEEMRRRVSDLLSRLREVEKGRLEVRPSVVAAAPLAETARLLQQLGALEYQDGAIVLSPGAEVVLADDLRRSGLGEDALWARLEAQRQRAQMIEKLALEEEKVRLHQVGRADLAEIVFRVSEINVAAGYDIESFEADGSRRCIEVKSSTGRQVRFEWSANERGQAEVLGGKYWIYFVPMAHALPGDFCPVLMIRDPIRFLRSGTLRERASAFEVVEASQTPIDSKVSFSLTHRMAEFWRR